MLKVTFPVPPDSLRPHPEVIASLVDVKDLFISINVVHKILYPLFTFIQHLLWGIPLLKLVFCSFDNNPVPPVELTQAFCGNNLMTVYPDFTASLLQSQQALLF